MEGEAALSYTPHSKGRRVANEMYKNKNKWAEKMYRELMWLSSRENMEPHTYIHTKKNPSPVGFRLFALTVDQPQVILRLLWTGLRVQVSHTDRLVWRGHIGQHCCWSDDITQCWVWGCVHHQASNDWLVSSFCRLWRREMRGLVLLVTPPKTVYVCVWSP